MKVLIYGSRGWMGKQFINLLAEKNIEYFEGKSRVDNFDDLGKEILEINPTNVISFIGRTHGYVGDKYYPTIDYLEQDRLDENVKDNLFSPVQLAFFCRENNYHFTYIGTGCIYEYDDKHTTEIGVKEEENANFFGSSYSIVKGYTDRLMKMLGILNLRVRMPINGERDSRNFIAKITGYKKICSHPNSMTVIPEIFPYIIKMMEMRTIGTYNMTNPGIISHNEILEMYREIVDKDFKWANMDDNEQNKVLSSKRSNTYLDTDKLQKLFPEVKSIREAVKDCLYKMREIM